MTIAQIGDFVKNTTARKRDRGGNSMLNLLTEALAKSDFNDERRKYRTDENNRIDDYGYVLYQSMEYNFKYLKNDDFGFRGNLLNKNIR